LREAVRCPAIAGAAGEQLRTNGCAGSARDVARARGFVVATGALALLWSTLPKAGGGWPVASLMSALPGLAQIRSVWRVGVITQVVVVVLAFVALDQLVRRATSQRARVGAWALVVAATLELWPRTPRLEPMPDPARWAPVVAWIEANVPERGTIAHLPMPASGKVADFAPTGRWMLIGALHHRRMINGYSSSFPLAHERLWKQLDGFPDDASAIALARAGVTAVVIEDAWLDAADRRARVTAAGWRTALAASEAGVTIVVR
jgi:hypothetical protein